ncbi:MAG: DUF5658 family protein [Acidimicrobiales bacterium]
MRTREREQGRSRLPTGPSEDSGHAPSVSEIGTAVAAIDLRTEPPTVTYRRVARDPRWIAFGALVWLNVIDVVTTAAVLAAGGGESNPLMRSLVADTWPAVILKAGVLASIGLMLARTGPSRRIEIALAAATGWYLAVVSWNLTVLTLG